MMGSEPPRKRSSLSNGDDHPPLKRQRIASLDTARPADISIADLGTYPVDEIQDEYHVNRAGLQRAIGLALQHVGFDCASQDALESFTLMTETYMEHLSKDVMSMANHARRNMVIPTDFELSLKCFNVNLHDLKKHRRDAIPRDRIKGPEKEEHPATEGEAPAATVGKEFTDLPCLDEELSGKADKEAKSYIPDYFPQFPSTHTYKYTPVDIESVTVRTPMHEVIAGGGVTKTHNTTQPAPDWRGDPKKIREAAAVQAKQAEEALRKLVRASKMASLKDLRSTAEKNPISKNRYDLWEEAMKDMLKDKRPVNSGSDANREDLAELSMVVNAEKRYHRREVPRSAKRKIADTEKG